MAVLRIIVAEDDSNFRRAAVKIIESAPDLKVIASCMTGEEAFEECLHLKPDILLADLELPKMSGMELVTRLLEREPNICVVILTVHEEEDMVFDALRAGACGFLLKTSTPQEILDAIRCASRGESKLSPRVARQLIDKVRETGGIQSRCQTLSCREREILRAIAKGMRNREISVEYKISEKTVKNHISGILRKLGVQTRTEAALIGQRETLLTA